MVTLSSPGACEHNGKTCAHSVLSLEGYSGLTIFQTVYAYRVLDAQILK